MNNMQSRAIQPGVLRGARQGFQRTSGEIHYDKTGELIHVITLV